MSRAIESQQQEDEVEIPQEFEEIDKLADMAIAAADIKKYARVPAPLFSGKGLFDEYC